MNIRLAPATRRKDERERLKPCPRKKTSVDREVHATVSREAGATVFMRGGSEMPVEDCYWAQSFRK